MPGRRCIDVSFLSTQVQFSSRLSGVHLLRKIGMVFCAIALGGIFLADLQADEAEKALTRRTDAEQKILDQSPFFREVKLHFGDWDLNKNQELSTEEIELALHNSSIRGAQAAAITSLRRAVRGDKELAPLSLDKIARGVVTKPAAQPAPPKYQSMFDTALKKIETTKRDLFADGPPQLESISQGRLGDCFLLVSMGTCAYCDPDRLMKMMQQQPDGKILVTLGSGRQLTIEAPTDGEVAIGATSRNTGCWTNTYEKAVGTVMLERASKKGTRHVTPLSLIGVGGTPSVPLEILTGHKVRKHSCQPYREAKDESGRSTADLSALRDDLKQAFAEKRLVVGGCGPKGSQTLVKGIYYNHSYGVLEYDEVTDTVLFWNPFGHKYTPKGPDGLENGYTTTNGKFRVPLNEAVMWFGSFSIETTEAAPEM